MIREIASTLFLFLKIIILTKNPIITTVIRSKKGNMFHASLIYTVNKEIIVKRDASKYNIELSGIFSPLDFFLSKNIMSSNNTINPEKNVTPNNFVKKIVISVSLVPSIKGRAPNKTRISTNIIGVNI